MPEVRTWLSVLIAALVASFAVSSTAQTVRPKIDVVLQLASSLSEDDPYGVNATALAFSPDRRLVASGDTNGVVKLWNVADGRLIRTISHPQQVAAVAFTPDGRRVITAAGIIRSWDAETGRLIHTFEESFRTSAVLAVSSDGLRVVAGSNHAAAGEWDIASGRKVRDYVNDLFGGPVRAAAFSHDRQLLATAHDGGLIRLWNTETTDVIQTFKAIQTFKGDSQPITQLSFSPDGARLLSYNTAGRANVWEVARGKDGKIDVEQIMSVGVNSADNHDELPVRALWTDWTTRVRMCCSDAIITYDIAIGTLARARTPIPSINQPTAVAFSGDGTLLALAARDGTLRLLQVESGTLVRIFNPAVATTILSIALSPEGTHVLAGENGSRIQVWDLSTARLLRTVETQVERQFSIAMSHDGRRVLVGNGVAFELRDVETGQLIRSFGGDDQDFRPVLLSPDGRLILASGSDGASVALWDVEDGRLVRPITGDLKTFNWAAFSADGRLLATDGEQRTVRVWDTATGLLVRTLKGLEQHTRPVGFSPDGRRVLIAGGDVSGVTMWEIESGKRVDSARYPDSGSYTFSPEGGRVLAHSHEDLQLFVTDTGQPVVTVAGQIPFQIPGEFLPDGQSWLSGSYDTTLTLRDVNTGGIIRTFSGHTGAVIALSIARDGKRAATGSPDTTIRLWNVDTGETLATLLAARNGEWIILTPEGFFSMSANGADLANVVNGFEVFPLQRFHQLLHRPDLVAEKIAGDPKGLVRDALAKLDAARALAAARQAK